MATVNVALMRAPLETRAAAVPVPDSNPFASEFVETSGASSTSSIVAPSGELYRPGILVWMIAVSGGDIRAKFGKTANATDDDAILIPNGQVRAFLATEGETVAVADL